MLRGPTSAAAETVRPDRMNRYRVPNTAPRCHYQYVTVTLFSFADHQMVRTGGFRDIPPASPPADPCRSVLFGDGCVN